MCEIQPLQSGRFHLMASEILETWCTAWNVNGKLHVNDDLIMKQEARSIVLHKKALLKR